MSDYNTLETLLQQTPSSIKLPKSSPSSKKLKTQDRLKMKETVDLYKAYVKPNLM